MRRDHRREDREQDHECKEPDADDGQPVLLEVSPDDLPRSPADDRGGLRPVRRPSYRGSFDRRLRRELHQSPRRLWAARAGSPPGFPGRRPEDISVQLYVCGWKRDGLAAGSDPNTPTANSITRARSPHVALDGPFVAHVRLVRVHSRAPTSPPLVEQVPALIQPDPEPLQPLVLLRGQSTFRGLLEELMLLVGELVDAIDHALVFHRASPFPLEDDPPSRTPIFDQENQPGKGAIPLRAGGAFAVSSPPRIERPRSGRWDRRT